MNTGRQALEDLGFKVEKYYSSEIKPYAIKLTQFHFPDTIQVGNILNWKDWDIDFSKIDLVLSGSPCQDLSQAGKRAGIYGKKSSLFFVFIEILNHIKKLNPNVKFLQENVGSASKKAVGIMSEALGVYPVRINSNLLTAQNRDRYYWTNIKTKKSLFDVITDIPQPKDNNILLENIIENGFVDRKKSLCLLEGYWSKKPKKDNEKMIKRYELGMLQIIQEKEDSILRVKEATKKGYIDIKEGECVDLSYPKSNTRRGRLMKEKSNALLRQNEFYLFKNNELRFLTQTEMERLQGFNDGYTKILTIRQACSLLGDGWTLPVIKHIFSFLKIN